MDDTTEEIFIYAGIRVKDSKKYNVWIPADEFTPDDPLRGARWYKAGRGAHAAVGSRYRATIKREGAHITLYGTPTYHSQLDDREAVAKLQAAHQAHNTKVRAMAMEASDKRNSEIDTALAPLLELAAHIPPMERDAFALLILRKIRNA